LFLAFRASRPFPNLVIARLTRNPLFLDLVIAGLTRNPLFSDLVIAGLTRNPLIISSTLFRGFRVKRAMTELRAMTKARRMTGVRVIRASRPLSCGEGVGGEVEKRKKTCRIFFKDTAGIVFP
jgi:hypothetical protein